MPDLIDLLCVVEATALCDMALTAARHMNPHMAFSVDVSTVARSMRAEVDRCLLDMPAMMAHRMEVAG